MSRIERDLRAVPQSEMTESERQVLADFQTALDWFGVKDADTWAAMSLEEQREHHEKFARGMEAYLFEGKAPSEALRGVFSRVARLLKRIYRTLAGLNVELSDDIREVFGRLLASDEQIAEAEYVNGMKLLLDEDAELRAMDEAARREAEDRVGQTGPARYGLCPQRPQPRDTPSKKGIQGRFRTGGDGGARQHHEAASLPRMAVVHGEDDRREPYRRQQQGRARVQTQSQGVAG